MTESNLKTIHLFKTKESYEDNKTEVGEDDLVLVPEGEKLDISEGIITNGIKVNMGDKPGQVILRTGAYSCILRNDGSYTYILLTDQNDPDGSWNNLRPISIDNATGEVHIGTGLNIPGGKIWIG